MTKNILKQDKDELKNITYSFLRGMGVAMVTPFNEKGYVDYKSLEKLIRHLSNKYASYLLLHGTTGEASTTTLSEKKKIIDYTSKMTDIPLIVGIGGNNTSEIIKSFEKYNFEQIKAILSVCPYYNKPTQDGIYHHYKALSEASSVPIILYNIPGRTGVNIEYDTILKLSELPNIIGIKEASGNFIQCMEIGKNIPNDFYLISGNDMDTIPIMSIGGSGVASVLGNVFPKHMHMIVEYCKKNNFNKAKEFAFDLLDLNHLLYLEGNPVGIKQLLELFWICKPFVRQPLQMASMDLKDKLKNEIKNFN